MSQINEIFGYQLKHLRENKQVSGRCLTQKELAKLLGVNQATITRWERGNFKKTPQIEYLSKLRDVYAISAEYFFMKIPCSVQDMLKRGERITHKLSFLTEEKFKEIETLVDSELKSEIIIQMGQPIRDIYDPKQKRLTFRRDMFNQADHF